jgi:hypothetical protein
MVRNTDGLKRNARSRSEDAMQRTTAAILLMLWITSAAPHPSPLINHVYYLHSRAQTVRD